MSVISKTLLGTAPDSDSMETEQNIKWISECYSGTDAKGRQNGEAQSLPGAKEGGRVAS